MITAIGNNFGAGLIKFKAYSTENILVLNGKVDVDVTNPDFLAASQLEIYLPDQPIRKSAETVVYMLMKREETLPCATVLRCRLVIEKCSLYQEYGNFSLLFYCAMVPKGEVGPFTFEGVTQLSASSETGSVSIDRSVCVVHEHWVGLFIKFLYCKTSYQGADFDFIVTGLPDDIVADVPIIEWDNSGYKGNPVMIANVVGPHFSIVAPSFDASNNHTGKFTKAFFVRGDND